MCNIYVINTGDLFSDFQPFDNCTTIYGKRLSRMVVKVVCAFYQQCVNITTSHSIDLRHVVLGCISNYMLLKP